MILPTIYLLTEWRMMTTIKTCFKCNIKKPISDFYTHKMMADGYLNKCKQCTRKDVNDHRHGNGRERVLAYDRARANKPERIANAKRLTSRWRTEHPERRFAQIALGNAVRSGEIKPWPMCAMPDCSSRPEAHHPDYSRPLDVVWLCSAHHKQAHALIRKVKYEHKSLRPDG
jgi:hypothetical protein